MGVVAIEANQDALKVFGYVVHLRDDLGRNAGALYHLDAGGHGVGFNSSAVVGTDINVNAQHLTFGVLGVERGAGLDRFAHVEQGKHGCAQDQRTAVGDARFDDQVGLDLPDQFLHGNHVLRVLDDGAAKCCEFV